MMCHSPNIGAVRFHHKPESIMATLCTTVLQPLGPEKTITPPIPAGSKRILHTKGKASREKGWWRTGTDKLASYGLDTEIPLLAPR